MTDEAMTAAQAALADAVQFSEEEFILRMHDRQMAATDNTAKLYYEMSKAVAPVIARMIHHAMTAPTMEERNKRVSDFTFAFSQFMGTQVLSVVMTMAGAEPDREKPRNELMEVFKKLIETSIDQRLAEHNEKANEIYAEVEAKRAELAAALAKRNATL